MGSHLEKPIDGPLTKSLQSIKQTESITRLSRPLNDCKAKINCSLKRGEHGTVAQTTRSKTDSQSRSKSKSKSKSATRKVKSKSPRKSRQATYKFPLLNNSEEKSGDMLRPHMVFVDSCLTGGSMSSSQNNILNYKTA